MVAHRFAYLARFHTYRYIFVHSSFLDVCVCGLSNGTNASNLSELDGHLLFETFLTPVLWEIYGSMY